MNYMKKPVIAMTLAGKDLFRRYMNSKYVQSLRRAGAKVRWIELGDPEKAIKAMLTCDGLLLPGGGDVDPAFYGQIKTPECNEPDFVRDTLELQMLKDFLPTGKPILGICRGIQVLNVFCGGTLYQDIKGIQTCRHSDFKHRAQGVHGITITQGTQLHRILGESELQVNSMHHQAADKPGKGLTVAAVSSDGFIEALEMPSHRFCIGLQWHPEHLSRRNAVQQKVFDAFVAACRETESV